MPPWYRAGHQGRGRARSSVDLAIRTREDALVESTKAVGCLGAECLLGVPLQPRVPCPCCRGTAIIHRIPEMGALLTSSAAASARARSNACAWLRTASRTPCSWRTAMWPLPNASSPLPVRGRFFLASGGVLAINMRLALAAGMLDGGEGEICRRVGSGNFFLWSTKLKPLRPHSRAVRFLRVRPELRGAVGPAADGASEPAASTLRIRSSTICRPRIVSWRPVLPRPSPPAGWREGSLRSGTMVL